MCHRIFQGRQIKYEQVRAVHLPESICAPVSVCHHVSTIGQRLSPTTFETSSSQDEVRLALYPLPYHSRVLAVHIGMQLIYFTMDRFQRTSKYQRQTSGLIGSPTLPKRRMELRSWRVIQLSSMAIRERSTVGAV